MIRETSIEAYNQIKSDGTLSLRRWEVYDALFRCGPATAMGVFEYMGQYRGPKITSNVCSRLAELREMGCVKEAGETVDQKTGMRVILWDVTKNLPVKIEKPKREKCPHCNGKGVVIGDPEPKFSAFCSHGIQAGRWCEICVDMAENQMDSIGGEAF